MALVTTLPHGRPLTRSDLDAMPDDGHRYELIDGVLVVSPSLMVARRHDLTQRGLPVAPVLAVEVLSPSTRRFDLMTKRSRYESAGTASYWVVDPVEPSLTAWELNDGAFVEVAHVRHDDPFSARAPFPVEVVPAELVAER